MRKHGKLLKLRDLGKRPVVVWGLVLALGLSAGGCTRRFYRKEADKEVESVLAEKDRYPAWSIDQFHVYPDPRARFGDPTNPDRPPRPPDDPAAYDLAPDPQKTGKAGIAQTEGVGYLDLLAAWDVQNRAEAGSARDQAGAKDQAPVEAPETVGGSPKEIPGAEPKEKPAEPAKDKQDGSKGYGTAGSVASSTSLSSGPGAPRPYLLKLEQAVELGLINSREYQDAREDLYLTALPVTLERFAFSAQFFAVEQAVREYAGVQSSVGPRNDWALNSNVGLSKLFSTGALLLFNFANQTVFNFTGPTHGLTSQSTIDLDLIQPFLRGGGKAVALEPLTQAERNLVYEIRNYARFRKEFYTAIAGGGGGSITGASFQPTGVIAFNRFTPGQGLGGSGLFPGSIAPVPVAGNPGLSITPGSAGAISLTTALSAPVSGYLSTLLQAAQMRVDEYNIEKLEGYLKLAKAMEEGGDISKLQVDQFEQQVLSRRTSLLNDQLQYLQSLDQFKLQLGLPTALPLELDDTPFRPLNQQFQRYEDLFKQFEAASREPLDFGAAEMVARVRKEMLRIFTTSAIVKGTQFRTKIGTSWAAWEKLSADDLKKWLTGYREERRRILDRKTELESKGANLNEVDQKRLDALNFEIDLGDFEAVLREYEGQPWKNVFDPEVRRRQQQAKYRYVVNAFILVLAEARNERVVQLRETWPKLARLCVGGVDLLKADVDTAQEAVVRTAVNNRLDLMNVRAEVVDAWRQVAVFANALLGTFNVQYHLNSVTPAGQSKPLAFSNAGTQHQLLLNTQLPLVRVLERNNYRASLINFQRARRILQRAEDGVAYDTRNEIRLLRQQEENYRIQQRQVELAYMTVENSLDTFQAPPAPVPAGQVPIDNATRAAALTTQLINAQTSLYTAQFAMTTIWITYLNTRLDLYRDMELMPLDYRGVWIDDTDTRECPDGSACASPRPDGRDPGSGPGAGGGQGAERLPEPRPAAPVPGAPVERPR